MTRLSILATLICLPSMIAIAAPGAGPALPQCTGTSDACDASSVSLRPVPVFLTVNPESNAASREIYLKNRCDSAVEGAVTAQDFVSEITGSPLHTESQFSELQQDGTWKRVRRVCVPAKGDALLKLDVTNLWEAGKATAAMLFDGHKLGDVSAYNYRLPFPLSLASATPLTLRKSETTSIILRNGGSRTYPISWSFGIGGEHVSGDTELSPGTDAEIPVTPPPAWFKSTWEGYFKPAESTAVLTLTMRSPAADALPDLPRKSLTVPVLLESYSEKTKAYVSTGIILGLLLVGALCSLIVNNWVPNRLRRIGLQQRVELIASRTRQISEYVDSELRVRLRVQRNQEAERLAKVWLWSPNFETVANEVSVRLDDIGARVDVACRLDDLVSRLRTDPDVPLSLADRWLTELEPAVISLRKLDLPAERRNEIGNQIAAVSAELIKIRKPNQDFAADLLKRLTAVRQRLQRPVSRSELFKRDEAPLKGLADELDDMPYKKYKKPGDIDPGRYCGLDLTLRRLDALLDAYEIYDSSGTKLRERMTERSAAKKTLSFMEILRDDYVALGTPEAVRLADLLVRQMRENVYADEISEALSQGEKDAIPQIELDPPKPRQGEAIRFSLSFPHAMWNRSAAQQRLTCQWDFGDGLAERGWVVTHYFPPKPILGFHREYEVKVTATIYDVRGACAGAFCRKFAVHKRKRGGFIKERTITEFIYMGVALGAAIAALAGGARESLLKLDFTMGLIAVFLVGFGADSIKSLLTNSKK